MLLVKSDKWDKLEVKLNIEYHTSLMYKMKQLLLTSKKRAVPMI